MCISIKANSYVDGMAQFLLLKCIKKSPCAGRVVAFLAFPIFFAKAIVMNIACMVENLAYFVLNLFGSCFSKKYTFEKGVEYLVLFLAGPGAILADLLYIIKNLINNLFGKIEQNCKESLQQAIETFLCYSDKLKDYNDSSNGELYSQLISNCRHLVNLLLSDTGFTKKQIKEIILRFGVVWKNEKIPLGLALQKYHYFLRLTESIRNLPSFLNPSAKNQMADLISTSLEEVVRETEVTVRKIHGSKIKKA